MSNQANNTPAPKRALVVIDVQNDYVTGNLRIEYPPVETSLNNIGRAMDAASQAGIPIVVVQHVSPADSPIFAQGSVGGAVHDAVASRLHDLLLEKRRTSALTETSLADWLTARSIDTLTIVGYMTHNCDHATTLEAARLGWKVEVLSDASGSPSYANAQGHATAEEIHRVFTIVMHTGFAAVATTAEWLEAIAAGKSLAPDSIVMSHRRAQAMRDGA